MVVGSFCGERHLLLILGPAASGKTTVLKTFMMEMVHRYADFVPVLMPIIEVAPILDKCDRNAGESVVAVFIRRKYPQHAHLLLQMMLMRRAVFLLDGIDESGTYREAVEDFITVELLEPGHKTIITSRHSGFTSDAFRQCRLVELLPLGNDAAASKHVLLSFARQTEQVQGLVGAVAELLAPSGARHAPARAPKSDAPSPASSRPRSASRGT